MVVTRKNFFFKIQGMLCHLAIDLHVCGLVETIIFRPIENSKDVVSRTTYKLHIYDIFKAFLLFLFGLPHLILHI